MNFSFYNIVHEMDVHMLVTREHMAFETFTEFGVNALGKGKEKGDTMREPRAERPRICLEEI